ncbi:MAG: iron-containing redox enzyme family protein [Bacteroidales bacterium]|nr:iron-containing redox enzyme family protein [Bacteroidales bacterium]
METKHQKIEALDEFLSLQWGNFFSSETAKNIIENLDKIDKRIYALYMLQVYHWSSQSARSLGIAGANQHNKDIRFMMHCFEHAEEETGHEIMALNDVKAVGVPINDESDIPPPLAETEVLIAYVKHLATCKKPIRMLGYDYWTEKPYEHIGPFVRMTGNSFNLSEKQMTFYISHEEIDKKHGKDIERVLVQLCKTEEDWEDITEVAKTTLNLTFEMIGGIVKEYEKLLNGEKSKYEILNKIIN